MSMNTRSFYLEDYNRTLFPLTTNKFLVEMGAEKIQEHIKLCFDDTKPNYTFLPQERVFASKQGIHLRRTFKLDVIAEYFMYDCMYRNRAKFRKPHQPERSNFGYRFEGGLPVSSTIAYKAFRTAIAKYTHDYKFFLSFDVATYFNSLYHHDLAAWFSNMCGDAKDGEQFGSFLRLIASGRSLDCLPQGIYPSKMVGNDFLRFIDDSMSLRSTQLLRFMDDFYLFSNDEHIVKQDFLLIQRMLGEKGLSVNPKKTMIQRSQHSEDALDIDEIKKSLLDKRRRIVDIAGYDDPDDFMEISTREKLSSEELSYISSLLSRDSLEEDDVELILSLMKDHADDLENKLEYIIANFPHLSKTIALFCSKITNIEHVASVVLNYAEGNNVIQEYQLFWFGYMLENYLIKSTKASALIRAIFFHPSATTISKAKILEIADNRFGLPDLRSGFLNQSSWLAWSAAVGSRGMQAAQRNYQLGYFQNASHINYLISDIIKSCP